MSYQLPLAIQLNHQATLADYCWGDNVLLQQQISLALSGNGEQFIYLWGESGCGKSHLLQACCQAMGYQNKSSVYLPLDFLKEWGTSCLEGLDDQALIAIDDIESITGDKEWEEALFHLYNRIKDNQTSLLLISAKQSPGAITIQLPDLRSRLSWGLSIYINELDDELKIVALQQHAQKRGFELPQPVAMFLIKRCARSMHSLNTVLDKLDEASLAAQRKLTIPFVKTVLAV